MELYLNPTYSHEERAKDLLQRLSLDEKMAQTVCAFPSKPGGSIAFSDYVDCPHRPVITLATV